MRNGCRRRPEGGRRWREAGRQGTSWAQAAGGRSPVACLPAWRPWPIAPSPHDPGRRAMNVVPAHEELGEGRREKTLEGRTGAAVAAAQGPRMGEVVVRRPQPRRVCPRRGGGEEPAVSGQPFGGSPDLGRSQLDD